MKTGTFASKNPQILSVGVSLLLALSTGCRDTSKNSNSSTDSSSSGLFQYQGDSKSELSLRTAPVTALALSETRASLGSVTDYFFRLKFYQVTYAKLAVAVNGSYEGDVSSIVDTGREMVISRDNILGGKILLTPVFDNGQFLADGYYAIVMCQNQVACTPPSIATLSEYKDAFLAGKCGDGTTGISTECHNMLLQDANTAYLGMVYPITIQSKKFTQGDYTLVYNAGGLAGLSLDGVQSQYVFESAGGGYEPVLQNNGSGQNVYDSLASSGSSAAKVDAATTSPTNSVADQSASQGSRNNGQDFWNGVGKALVWIAQNSSSSSGGDNTAANNAANASRVASSNAASAAASAAAARASDCFVAGSRIAVVSFGTNGAISQVGEKEIESIVVGDYVYNPLLRTAARVKAVFKQGNSDAIYTLTVSSTTPQVNKELTVTAAHPVITKAGLKPVALLTQTDKIMMINKIPVTSQMDYSWFSVQKLLRTSAPGAVQVYNLQIDDTAKPIQVGADAGGAWWYYALSKDTSNCPNDGDGCSKYFMSSNQIVTGDLTRQQETEKLLQQAFVQVNNPN